MGFVINIPALILDSLMFWLAIETGPLWAIIAFGVFTIVHCYLLLDTIIHYSEDKYGT